MVQDRGLTLPPDVVARLLQPVTKMDLVEVSLVSRPAHPEARITRGSVDVAELQDALGPEFRQGMPLACEKCLQPGPWTAPTEDAGRLTRRLDSVLFDST